MAFTSTIAFSAEDVAAAATMEPAFENLMLWLKIHKDVIVAMRIAEITDRGLFVALDTTLEGLASSVKEAFGSDSEKGFTRHERELGKLSQAWTMGQGSDRCQV